jgi:hypothetical protein
MIPQSIEYKLAIKQLETFQKDQIGYLNGLVGCDSVRVLMNNIYGSFVRANRFTAIEDLPIDQKKELWLTAKDFSKDRLNNEGMIQMAHVLYLMEYLLSL